MMQGKSLTEGHIMKGNKKENETRIHPTQKPIDLYKWIVKTYCKEGWNVLDTHVGSASSLVTYEDAGLEYVGFEIDNIAYEKSRKRLEDHLKQLVLF